MPIELLLSRFPPGGLSGFFLDKISLCCYIYMALEVLLPSGSFLFSSGASEIKNRFLFPSERRKYSFYIYAYKYANQVQIYEYTKIADYICGFALNLLKLSIGKSFKKLLLIKMNICTFVNL